jgi:hypothetical protein
LWAPVIAVRDEARGRATEEAGGMSEPTARGGIYIRARDREVALWQHERCLALVAARRWQVAGVYVDTEPLVGRQ